MANTDALKQQGARAFTPTLKSHLAYTLLSGLVIMLMLSLVRLALLIYNSDMIGDTPIRPSPRACSTVCASTCGWWCT